MSLQVPPRGVNLRRHDTTSVGQDEAQIMLRPTEGLSNRQTLLRRYLPMMMRSIPDSATSRKMASRGTPILTTTLADKQSDEAICWSVRCAADFSSSRNRVKGTP